MDKTLADIIRIFTEGGVEVELLPKDEQQKPLAMADFITTSVGYLSTVFPNERINSLMAQVWAILGTRHVRPILGPPVPTISFAVMRGEAVILMPHHYLDLIEKDPLMQTSALVFIGSQVIDFWNGRMDVKSPEDPALKAVSTRALAHEAEFILTLVRLEPRLQSALSGYPQKLLAQFPEGLSTPGVEALLYEPKPVPDHSPYVARA